MGTSFRPWRRKIGVITLVIACVFMGAWVRGFRTLDHLAFGTPIAYVEFQIEPEVLLVHCGRVHFFDPGSMNELRWFYRNGSTLISTMDQTQMDYREEDRLLYGPFNVSSFGMGTSGWSTDGYQFAFNTRIWTLSLLIVSAWLLFGKPRAGKLSSDSPPTTGS